MRVIRITVEISVFLVRKKVGYDIIESHIQDGRAILIQM